MIGTKMKTLATTRINMPDRDALIVRGVMGSARKWNNHRLEEIPLAIWYNPEMKAVICEYLYYPWEPCEADRWKVLITSEQTTKRMDNLSIMVLVREYEVKNAN